MKEFESRFRILFGQSIDEGRGDILRLLKAAVRSGHLSTRGTREIQITDRAFFQMAFFAMVGDEYLRGNIPRPPLLATAPVDPEITRDLVSLVVDSEAEIPPIEWFRERTSAELSEIDDWAASVHLSASDNDGIDTLPKPESLEQWPG